jgi:hypothetical protein
MTRLTNMPLPFDPVAFALALIGGPLLVTLLTCWLLFIPVAALIVGGPIYLIVGTPVLLWMVGRYPPEVSHFALAAFTANIVLCLLIVVVQILIPAARDSGTREFILLPVCGLFFGPLWAGAFASIYRRFNRMARLVPQS